MGIDLERLLERVEETVEACHGEEGNPGLELGLELGNGWHDGRDKVTINPNPGGFGLWAEQLLAESTGKDGKGLIPAPEESPEGPDRQAPEVRLPAPYELGQEFYRWEFATAVAGSILGINPFDQPNVQAAKDKTNEVLAAGEPDVEPRGSLDELFAQARPGDYVAVQAFIDPEREARAGAAARARPRGHRLRGHARPRPALPALDRPAAQGRPEHRALRPGGRRRRRRAADPGPRLRLPAADPLAGGRRPGLARGARPQNRPNQTGGPLVQLGMVGLGRMGGNMTKRLEAAGHEVKTFDPHVEATASSLEELAQQLDAPRSVWLMVPAGIVDTVVSELAPHLEEGDTIVDGGNSYYVDDLRRAKPSCATAGSTTSTSASAAASGDASAATA